MTETLTIARVGAQGDGIVCKVMVDGSPFKKLTLRCRACNETWIVTEESSDAPFTQIDEHPLRSKPDRPASGR